MREEGEIDRPKLHFEGLDDADFTVVLRALVAFTPVVLLSRSTTPLNPTRKGLLPVSGNEGLYKVCMS